MDNEINSPEIMDLENSAPLRRESNVKQFFNKLGAGGLVVSGGVLFVAYSILQFVVVALSGLGMVWGAITLFSKGSIVKGVLVLLVGTPVAISLVSIAFPIFLFMGLVVLIIWGVVHFLGSNITYWDMIDQVWLWLRILFLGIMAFFGIAELINAIKRRDLVSYFKEYWLGILVFCFLAWLFFR